MTCIDPTLVGTWIVPGSQRTYAVDPAGGYHVAEAESAMSFQKDGAIMVWEGEVHDRCSGKGETPVGTWVGRATGALWTFVADGGYSVTLDGRFDTGRWELRRNGTALWTQELVAQVSTDGAHIAYHMRDGACITFGYSVCSRGWVLYDPVDWTELGRLIDPTPLSTYA